MIADIHAALVTTTLAGSLLILGMLAARVPLRRWFGAQLAYAAWLVVPLAALALLLPAPLQPMATMVLQVLPSAQGLARASAPLPQAIDWRPLLLLLWLLGVLATLAAFALQQRRYLRSLGRLHALDSDPARRVLRAEALAGGPSVVGAWRPRIVLPGDFDARYAPGERELILAHERLHLARGDTRINALVALLRGLNWFNPLVHYAARCLRVDQELACDAGVIARFPQARRLYANAMLKTQLPAASRHGLRLPAGCHWTSGDSLKERITMLKQPLPTRVRHVTGIALLALLGLGSAYVAWASQAPRPASDAAAREVVLIDAHVRIGLGAGATSAHVVQASGVPFRMRSDVADETWEAEVTARALEDGNFELAIAISHDGPPFDNPLTMVVRPGQRATAFSSRPGLGPLRLAATLTLAGNDAASRAPSYARLSRPQYPAAAIERGVQGVVVVVAQVDEHGAVASARVERIDPPTASALGDAAVAAVREWTFDPAMHAGNAVAGEAWVPLRFSISDSGSTAAPAPALALSTLPPGALDTIDVVGTRGK